MDDVTIVVAFTQTSDDGTAYVATAIYTLDVEESKRIEFANALHTLPGVVHVEMRVGKELTIE